MGKRLPLKDGTPKGIYKPLDVNLAPGKEIVLYELQLELSNNKGIGVPRDSTLYGTGKFSVHYERVLGSSSLSSVAIKFDPILSKLATGKLVLEVTDALKVKKVDEKKSDKESDPAGADKGDATATRQWEYKALGQGEIAAIDYKKLGYEVGLERGLNELGKQGWELVAFQPPMLDPLTRIERPALYVFKRHKK
jgi:hypothetical protein